ncbi:hypothetical protein [Streptomyces fradiae]|uniref:hypothetical protein n=1 Tax=Streptomyces fradiae TaxID=1906 RepID=UPI00398871CE
MPSMIVEGLLPAAALTVFDESIASGTELHDAIYRIGPTWFHKNTGWRFRRHGRKGAPASPACRPLPGEDRRLA